MGGADSARAGGIKDDIQSKGDNKERCMSRRAEKYDQFNGTLK